jgi:ATP-dependent Clp protease adaptor protein ClpS
MSQYKPYQEDELLLDTEELNENKLVLYNDDVNTFDWVIESLIKVCQHQREQAEQCSLIVHYNGRCSVKEGAYDKLKPLCEALHERGLTANIE